MFCEKCGNQVAEGSKFCMSCGARIEQKKAEQEVAAGIESVVTKVSEPTPVFVPPVVQPQAEQPKAPQPQAAQSDTAKSQTYQPVHAQVIQSTPQPAQTFQPAQTKAGQSTPQPVQTKVDQSTPQPAQTFQAAQTYQSTPQPVQTKVDQSVPQPVQTYQSATQPAVPKPVKAKKPAGTTPIPVWKYIGIFILSGIPVLGIVMLFIWAFNGSFNLNTRNYARAVLICTLVFIIISLVGYFSLGGAAFLRNLIVIEP